MAGRSPEINPGCKDHRHEAEESRGGRHACFGGRGLGSGVTLFLSSERMLSSPICSSRDDFRSVDTLTISLIVG